MKNSDALNQFMRTVSLLVTLIAVAFSLPSAAHANMMTQTASQPQHVQSNDMVVDHIKMDHDDQVIANSMTHEKSGDGHGGAQCCFGICGDGVTLTMCLTISADEVHEHDALPYLVMASAERAHLIRPPNL